jgi:ParB-like chromosome segregation protein Spo0J
MVEFLPEEKERFTLTPRDLISLNNAGVKDGAYAMRPLNQQNFDSLLLSDPAEWPPILVTLSIRGYVLIDGYHRWEVAKFRRIPNLVATCKAFQSETDVVEAAFRANLVHGLAASQENRSDYAFWLHVIYPDMQQQEIARRACVTQSVVSKAISRRAEEARKARQEEALDTKERQERIKKYCRSFTKVALRFLHDVEAMDDAELQQVLSIVIKKNEDRTRLMRIGRLLNSGDEPTEETQQPTQPLLHLSS